jgi:hypothetical protein
VSSAMNEPATSRRLRAGTRFGAIAVAATAALLLALGYGGVFKPPSREMEAPNADEVSAGTPAPANGDHDPSVQSAPSSAASLGSPAAAADTSDLLGAYRATSAADALRFARSLDPESAARADILGMVASICVRLTDTERHSFVAEKTEGGWIPDTDQQRRLVEAWWDRRVRYCGDIVGEAVREEATQTSLLLQKRLVSMHGPDGIDLSDLARLDDDMLLGVLASANEADVASALGVADVADRAWSTFLTASNPNLAIMSGTILASSGQGPFAETRKLLELDPSDPRLWEGNTFHASSRPGSREIRVWEATVEMYTCRSALVCGPDTARGLFRRPVSGLHLATGVEGYWRSMLTPVEWEAVEIMLRRLEVERKLVRAK